MKHIGYDFTHDHLQEVFKEGKQALLNGESIACPYIGQLSLPLRIKWLAGYGEARKQQKVKS